MSSFAKYAMTEALKYAQSLPNDLVLTIPNNNSHNNIHSSNSNSNEVIDLASIPLPPMFQPRAHPRLPSSTQSTKGSSSSSSSSSSSRRPRMLDPDLLADVNESVSVLLSDVATPAVSQSAIPASSSSSSSVSLSTNDAALSTSTSIPSSLDGTSIMPRISEETPEEETSPLPDESFFDSSTSSLHSPLIDSQMETTHLLLPLLRLNLVTSPIPLPLGPTCGVIFLLLTVLTASGMISPASALMTSVLLLQCLVILVLGVLITKLNRMEANLGKKKRS